MITVSSIKISNTSTSGNRIHSDDVILDNVPDDCKVYFFVFGHSDLQIEIKDYLQLLGKTYKKNLFVGFWNMGDSNYKEVSTFFNLDNLPSIVVTAESSLASINNITDSVYIKLDNPNLISDIKNLKELLSSLFNIFIQGRITEAIKISKEKNRIANIKFILNKFGNLFSGLSMRIMEHYNIEIEFGSFKAKLIKRAEN